LQSHLEFEIVTPRTLDGFRGDVLILPDARCLSAHELESLHSYTAAGKALITTGQTGKYDDTGSPRVNAALKSDYPNCPGKIYYAVLQKEFNQNAAQGEWDATQFDNARKRYVTQILGASGYKPNVEIDASPFVATQIANVDGKVSVFLANFGGLKSKEIAQQIPARNIKITFSTDRPHKIAVLPFLGDMREIEGTFQDGKLSCEIPSIDKGTVVWLE
jgi:hypothetical protein